MYKEDEEKCKAFGSGVISCVVDPLFRDQPECQCHTDFRMSEAGICVGMGKIKTLFTCQNL